MEHEEPPVQMPNTVEGMSIHLSYIRRDLREMNKKLDNLGGMYVPMEVFAKHLEADQDHENRIRKIEEHINSYPALVSLEAFDPVKKLVYGCTAIILSSVVMAIIYLVVNR